MIVKTSMEKYRYPSQFEDDGVVYTDPVCRESLPWMKKGLKLESSDIVIACYPKSGQCHVLFKLHVFRRHDGS